LHRYLQGHDIVICLIDTAQINLGKDNWYLFVAVDQIKHCVYVKLHGNKRIAPLSDFLSMRWRSALFKCEEILTGNGPVSATICCQVKKLRNKVRIRS